MDQLPLGEEFAAVKPAVDPSAGNASEPEATTTKKPSRARARPKKPVEVAEHDPVAEVVVDVNALGVDHTFDYLVPKQLSDAAQPGARVRVRFAGRLVDGFVLRRAAQSEHSGKLAALTRVLGPAVLTPEVATLARAVADRYAGTMSEVLRDAIPPRHAGAERAALAPDEGSPVAAAQSVTRADEARDSLDQSNQVWREYEGADSLRSGIAQRGNPLRAGLTFAAADDPVRLLADLAQAARSSHADGAADEVGVLIVVPDVADLARLRPEFERRFAPHLAVLSAADSAATRYGEFLKIRSGRRRVVIGTRSAVFAPVVNLGLIVVFDDSDDSLVEPRAPGWHAREVAALRSLQTGANLVIAGFARSVEVQRLVARGWLESVQGTRSHRQQAARVLSAANARASDPGLGARFPQFAWQVIKRGLQTGPVLVQVGMGGYLPALACQECREVASCSACSGPLGRSGADSELSCQWCGLAVASFVCPTCSSTALRAVRVGSHRTRDELAAAFPDVPVLVSGADTGVIRTIGSTRQIVVATVGAEPVVAGGYQAAVLLDGNAMLARADLRSEEQTVRRWFNTVSLVKPADSGGTLAITADPQHRAVQALVRADPVGWAQRELADREQTGLPPASRCAVVSGSESGVAAFLAAFAGEPVPRDWRVLGPTAVRGHPSADPNESKVLIFVPTAAGVDLARRVRAALLATPNETAGIRLRLRIDPISILG